MDVNLKRLYGEILVGYSQIKLNGSVAYVGHFGPRQQASIDAEYDNYLNYFLNEGIKREKDRLDEIIRQKLWEEEKETRISTLRGEILKLKDTVSKLIFKEQKESPQNVIKEKSKVLEDLWMERAAIVGTTADHFANRKINELYVRTSIFKDSKLEHLFYEDEMWQELEDEEVSLISKVYENCVGQFTELNIKKVALMNQFQNYFSLASEDGFTFFNKPIIELTFFQSQLVSYGRYFRHILGGDKKPPVTILDDPDKLMEWFNSSKKIEEATASKTGNVGFVGATNQELQSAGFEVFDVQAEAAKNGGKLSSEQMMNIFKMS